MALTWRNVDGPDFRSAMDGYRSASNLFSDAFSGLSRGLDTYDASISRAANNGLLLDFAGIQDAATAKARLAALASDPNRARYNAGTIDAVTGRPAALTEQAARESNLDFTNWTRGREKSITGAKDAAAAMLPEYQAAAAAGKGDEFRLSHPGMFKGLDLATTSELVAAGDNYRKSALGITGQELGNESTRIGNVGARQNNEIGAFNFGQLKLNTAETRQAADLVAGLRGRVSTAEDVEYLLNNDPSLKGASGVVKNAVRAGLGGGLGIGPISASLGGAGGGGSGGNAALSMTYGGGSLPENIQTVGDVIANKSNLVNSLGASPVGMYQINAGTWAEFAPSALGSNWKGASVRDFATQDAVAKKIFESTGGDPRKLMGRWASIKDPAQAAAIAKMPWEQAREYIAKGETGSSASQMALASSAAAQGVGAIAARTAANNPLAIDFAKTSQDGRDVVAVADELRGGTLKGTDRGAIVGRLRQIMQEGGVNAATAAAVLTNNLTQSDQDTLGGAWRRLTGGSANLGGSLRVNDRGVMADIKQLKNPQRIIDSSISRQADGQRVQAIGAAQSLLQTAEATYNARLARKRLQPDLPMEQVTADLIKARAAVRAASGEGISRYAGWAADPNNGVPQPPAPPPPPVVIRRPATPAGTVARPTTNYNGPLSANGESRESMWRRAMQSR